MELVVTNMSPHSVVKYWENAGKVEWLYCQIRHCNVLWWHLMLVWCCRFDHNGITYIKSFEVVLLQGYLSSWSWGYMPRLNSPAIRNSFLNWPSPETLTSHFQSHFQQGFFSKPPYFPYEWLCSVLPWRSPASRSTVSVGYTEGLLLHVKIAWTGHHKVNFNQPKAELLK